MILSDWLQQLEAALPGSTNYANHPYVADFYRYAAKSDIGFSYRPKFYNNCFGYDAFSNALVYGKNIDFDSRELTSIVVHEIQHSKDRETFLKKFQDPKTTEEEWVDFQMSGEVRAYQQTYTVADLLGLDKSTHLLSKYQDDLRVGLSKVIMPFGSTYEQRFREQFSAILEIRKEVESSLQPTAITQA